MQQYNKRMVNAVDIVVPIIIGILIVCVSSYLFTMYCHPDEKGFGVQVFPKILVIISQALAWGQLLLLPLDLSISIDDPSTDFSLVYYIVYTIIFFLLAFLNPFAIFFYSSDQHDTFFTRFCWSFLFAFIIAVIWCAGVFISYIWLSVYIFNGVQFNLPIPMYIFLIMTLVGWIILALNGGIGIIYLPTHLIEYFIYRPKQLTAEEAMTKKQLIQTSSADLIGLGEKLKQMEMQLRKQEGGWFTKKRNESKFIGKIDDYKQKVIKLQESYELFDAQVKLKTKHPVVYVVSLIGGIVAIIFSSVWFIQIMGTLIFINGEPWFLLLDVWMASLSQGSGSFVATMIYGMMVVYVELCLVKGSTVFGLRIPLIVNLHPLKINKTYMNSLLFNCNLMMLASVSTTILSVWAFPTYLHNTYIYNITYHAFYHLLIFHPLYSNRIPMLAFQAVTATAFIFIIAKLIYRQFKHSNNKHQDK